MGSQAFDQILSQVTGYRSITSYWDTFSNVEISGEEKVLALYEKVFEECKADYKRLTELVFVLNYKAHINYLRTETRGLGRLYSRLYYATAEYALDHLRGAELSYYLEVTD